MLPAVEQLLVLQDRDIRIRRLRQDLQRLPREEELGRSRLAAEQARSEAARDRLRENEVAMKALELDIETRRQTILRLKNQQFETRKNEEYRALAHEIERYEKDVSQLEDRVLEFMEKGESLQAEVSQARESLTTVQKQVELELAALQERRGTEQTRLLEVEEERARLAAGVEESALRLYERILKSKGDSAVVELDPDSSNCGGCHMKVTTSTLHRARAAKELTHCEQCGRILYLRFG
ncbi:MAG TPA: C4-type zinc ribbon domain-containing protein [Verrucomicrobiales bacterium]|nr:C4-type zinc ribbon domain-containing protein [Verrucomicrobiales bacterium]